MKSYRSLATYPVSLPISPDDIVEFHLARILLLIRLCGSSNKINGLTKFAKLDFFVRYPDFFKRAISETDKGSEEVQLQVLKTGSVESSMVRHHYGPWDKRYYHILAHLAAKKLIEVSKHKNTYIIRLTEEGKVRADMLKKDSSFKDLTSHMAQVKKSFGHKNGTFLKNLIYKTFDKEVADRPLGERIDL